jgi:deoxyribonuclease V
MFGINPMKLVVDVQYTGDNALAAGILFDEWDTSEISQKLISHTSNVEKYEPGKFYKRELPCLLKLIKEHQINPDIIIIDGYVFLDGVSQAGLGKYLYDSLHTRIPIIGVAKKAFKNISPIHEIYRGKSKKPLFITSVDISLTEAKEKIQVMHGKNRIPTLLKRADQLCREIDF